MYTYRVAEKVVIFENKRISWLPTSLNHSGIILKVIISSFEIYHEYLDNFLSFREKLMYDLCITSQYPSIATTVVYVGNRPVRISIRKHIHNL